jgi:hypothetical protein
MSRVILVAMLPPAGATLCDLPATKDKTTPRTGTSSVAQALRLRPPEAGVRSPEGRNGGDDGHAPLVRLRYTVSWLSAIRGG